MGKARVAGWALVTSATCAGLTAGVFGARPLWIFALVMIWVSPSSPTRAVLGARQRYAPPDQVGTALTLQTSVGAC